MNCPDCGVRPNQQHKDFCDVERCPECGGQFISCDCFKHTNISRLRWTGEWPGVLECREFGWYAKLTTKGWIECSKNDPEATEDLNRLHRDAKWDKKQGRFIL